MRWIFAETDEELARREGTLARMDAFWRGFAEHTADFSAVFRRQSDFDLVGWMRENLGAVDPRIMWEFGPAVRGEGHRLVATTEGAHELRPMVDALMARAPTIEGWEFYGYRMADPPELALQGVQARTGIDMSDAKVSVSLGEERTIEIRVCTPKMSFGANDAVWSAGLVAIEALAGEETLDRWIGAIDVAPMPKPVKSWGFAKSTAVDDTLVPLGELKPRVDALIERLKAERAPTPFTAMNPEAAEWSMLQLEPSPADDYPGQADLAIVRTCALDVWKASHGPGLFFDERFSAHGESFAFLKIDQEHVDPSARVEAKTPIEEAVMAHLAEGRRGALIASGTGIRYAYLEVALSDRERVGELRSLLQRLGVPKRSWLFFFESHLGGEWVGVYPDTPHPPVAPPQR